MNVLLATLAMLMLSYLPAEAKSQCCKKSCIPVYTDDCNWQHCHFGGSSTFEVEALIWKTCIEDLDYAAKILTTGDTTRVYYQRICPDWEAGIRFSYEMPSFLWDWGFMASYTIVDYDDSAKVVRAGSITSPMIHQGVIDELDDKAVGDWELCYHDWDLLLSYHLSCGQCHHIKPYLGVAGVFIEQKLKTKFMGEREDYTVRWHSRYRGYGLRAGSEYQYVINKCLRVYSDANATLLAGEGKSKNKQVFDEEIKLKDNHCCHFIPGYHIGAGILSDMWICDVMFTLRIGYEFVQWFNLPNNRGFTGDNITSEASHATSSSVRNLGFHGVNAGISMTF